MIQKSLKHLRRLVDLRHDGAEQQLLRGLSHVMGLKVAPVAGIFEQLRFPTVARYVEAAGHAQPDFIIAPAPATARQVERAECCPHRVSLAVDRSANGSQQMQIRRRTPRSGHRASVHI